MNMPVLIYDRAVVDELLKQRMQDGRDRYDEVWDGVYVMSPIANNEQQGLVSELVAIFKTFIDWQGLGRTFAGANISDRKSDWKMNYRVPDVLVFSQSTAALDQGSHWFGGPDLAIEIVSPGDRTYEKLGFYATAGVRELLIVDRHPWKLTLLRRSSANSLDLIHAVEYPSTEELKLETFPLVWQWSSTPAAIQVSSLSGQLLRSIAIEA